MESKVEIIFQNKDEKKIHMKYLYICKFIYLSRDLSRDSQPRQACGSNKDDGS